MDINAEFPAPSNPAPGSPEALLQDVMNVAAADGGSWLEGRHVYYARTMEGATDQQAMYEAVNAAAHGHAGRVQQAMARYNAFYYNNGSGNQTSKRRRVRDTVVGVFGSNR